MTPMAGAKGQSYLDAGVLCVLAAVAACPPSRPYATRTGVTPMQVEVDVYSGRPNPRWDLSPRQAEELREMVRKLPGREGESFRADNLGYRGLIVRAGGSGEGDYDELVIGSGVVVARGRGGAREFTDAGRATERWVLKTGEGRLEGDLYEYLSAEVGQS